MSNFIPLPPTYAVADPQVRAVLDVLSRNMQAVIDSTSRELVNTTLTPVGGASSFGSAPSNTNVTNLAPSYTLDTLTADLKRGAAEVITGVTNGTTIMKLEPAGQYVVFQHKDAVVLGTTGAYSGTIRTALGITSTGIVGGYNRTSDGAWQTTFAIESSTGNLTLKGDIIGGSNINITGTGIFNGASASGPGTFAVVANPSVTGSNGGVIAYASTIFNGAVMGYASSSAFGGYFQTTGSQAALASFSSGSGAGLQVGGTMTINNSTLVTNLNADLLDGNHASAFLPVGGNAVSATYATSAGSASTASLASDSNALGGYSASSWARIFPTNSGTADAGGSGLNLLGSGSTGIAGAYVGTSGSGNTVTFTVQTSSPSDPRLKKDIQDSDLGLEFVKGLIPKKYRLIHDPKEQFGYGFLTTDVEKLIAKGSSLVYHEPDLMAGDDKGFDVVHYPSYIAVLTKAIQELSAKVEILEAR